MLNEGFMTHRIILQRESEAFIDRMLETGRFATASDVVLEALLALEDAQAAADARRARVEAKIMAGLADLDAGRSRPADEVFAELRARLASRDAAE